MSGRVLVAMENQRRKYGELNFLSWLWRWILRLTIGYGYRPWYALLWGIGFVVLGASFFSLGYRWGDMTPKDAEAYKQFKTNIPAQRNHDGLPPNYIEFSAPIYSLDAFLPIVNLGEKDQWMPNRHKGDFGKFLRIWLWIHIGLGWLLTTLFVAGLTPVIRSD